MYLGKIAEIAESEQLYSNPRHPYTRALLSAIPIPDPTHKNERIILQGDVPSPLNPPEGCYFHPRCPSVQDRCRSERPVLSGMDPRDPLHQAACHFPAGGNRT
jgi:oligopeptide/dipeptide ABC transporter ATP-binding protein